jgi:hypothetical protein
MWWILWFLRYKQKYGRLLLLFYFYFSHFSWDNGAGIPSDIRLLLLPIEPYSKGQKVYHSGAFVRIAGFTTLFRSSNTYFILSCWQIFMDDQKFLLERKLTWIEQQSYILHLACWPLVQNFMFPFNFGADDFMTMVLSFWARRNNLIWFY